MVSIIIPTYKRSTSLCRAIDSCLAQTYKDIEIIVVDDNDPDSSYRTVTAELMKKYQSDKRITYLQHSSNKNGAAARNTGIKYAHGDYITFLDDDDILKNNKIEKQINAIKQKEDTYGIVCCGVDIREEGTERRMKTIKPHSEYDIQYDMLRLRFGMGTGSNPLFSKKAIQRTGEFDVSFLRHQDLEYVIRVLRNYKMEILSDILIIKYESGHPNRPDVAQYMDIQKHFFDVFRSDIMKYTLNQQNEIYRNHWHQMCIVSLDARNWKSAKMCYKKAQSYCAYTLKMRLGIIRHIINKNY